MTPARVALTGVAVAAALAAGSCPAVAADAALERERLQLDVDRLERENRVEGRIRPFIPLVGVVVGIGAGFVGFWRWRTEQRIARELRIEEGIASNIERLVDRPKDGTSRSARAVAALQHLTALTPDPDGWFRKKERRAAVQSRRSRVTKVLEAIVLLDLSEYRDAGDARLAAVCVEEWQPFEQRVRGTDLADTALDRLAQALAQLRKDNPPLADGVRADGRGGYAAPGVTPSADQRLLLRESIEAYRRYVALASEDTKAWAIPRFRSALNDGLADELFPEPTASSGKG